MEALPHLYLYLYMEANILRQGCVAMSATAVQTIEQVQLVSAHHTQTIAAQSHGWAPSLAPVRAQHSSLPTNSMSGRDERQMDVQCHTARSDKAFALGVAQEAARGAK